MRGYGRLGAAALAVGALAILIFAGSSAGGPSPGKPTVAREVLFSSDGMRPDLMERYAGQGFMPTYAGLMRDGVRGKNGMVQAFPPNTGVGWYTMATGAYPGEHGSTNNTYFRSGDIFSNRTSFSAAGTLQADQLGAAAERAGKKVAQIDWVGGLNAGINGPTVDFANFFTFRGVLVGQLNPTEQAGAAAFGTNYQVGSWAPATGWSNVPTGDPAAPPMEITGGWAIPSSFLAQNPNRTYNAYAYDSNLNGTAAYDHVVIATNDKNGGSGALDLAVGDFEGVKITLTGARAGQLAGQYIKLISLSPNLSNFKLYTTSIARAAAHCSTAACNALPHLAGEDPLEAYIANNLPPWTAADFAPEEGGVIDEETYVQQGRDLESAHGNAVLQYILGTLQPDTEVALVGYPFTDEISHQFMGLVSPTNPGGAPNPCYDVTPKFDDVACTGRGTAGRVAIREGFIRSAYEHADHKLGLARSLMGGNPTTVAASDHGFAPQYMAVNANAVLNAATVNGVSLHASNANASNCGAATTDLAKACWAGGTIQVYVNTTLPAGITYAAVRTAAINAFQNLHDPNAPSAQVVSKVMKKEELRNVDGSDSLHPNRSGDVVVVLYPPYQSDAGANGKAIALSHFFGQHGYLPNLVDLDNNINMHATFVAGGPGIKRSNNPIAGVRAVDLAPTLAFLGGYPGPQNARGRILYDITTAPSDLREITILDISDYHGQLVPLTDTADNLTATGTTNAAFNIGGSAFLKPWFDLYRSEAKEGSITMAAGDSVGATPPISSFFGDTPTIELMNLMGIGLDGLGNHNFDKGQAYLRNTLIPLANFPYLSANVVDADGNTPAEWDKSRVFVFDRGTKVAFVGFTNDDAPTLVTPGAFDPFHVGDPIAAVNAEVAKYRQPSIGAVVAFGHYGATSGTLTGPTGPLVDLADNVDGVDAVIGDHTDFQVLTTRPNGVLVTENRSKGIRFTRVRLVIDPGKGVVYKTADFHKPWDIGVTPDPAIQARIDALTAQLTPILGTVIGSANKVIPRADQCGTSNGRTCESLVGNVTTDAMRTKYASIGTQFAITNSGGLRDNLTCPPAGGGGGLCPAFTPPPWQITRGQVLAVLPFGNVVVTLSVNGAELKTMLENGVSRMPAIDGRFPQVSGLCFTYDIAAPAGSRVTSAVVADASGNCTATPVDLTSATTYKIAENDFMAKAGDGYPDFSARMTTQDIMDQVLADHVTANSPLSPVVKAFPNGRVNCADSNGAAAPNCPTLVPSP